MYVTPKQKKRYILNALLIAISIPLTVLAGYTATQLLSSADEAAVPQDVAIANLTTNSVAIGWTTSVEASGEVTAVSGGTETRPYIDFRGVSNRKTHYVEIVDLEPGTDYTFSITSNGAEYTSEGSSSFSFKTSSLSDDVPVPNPVYGSIGNLDGDDALVYLFAKSPTKSLPLAAIPGSTGNWIIDLSSLRSLDGTKLIPVSADTEITVVVIGVDGLGATLTGVFSEIFDDGGRLADANALTLSDNPGLISTLPEEALIDQIIAVEPVNPIDPLPPVDPTPVDPTPVDPTPVEPTPVEPTPVDPTPVEPEPVVPTKPIFNINQREFLVKADVNWNDMVLGASTESVDPDVVTGATTIKVVNQTDNSFAITWLSDFAEEGSVSYGTVSTSLDEEGIDVRDSLVEKGEYYSHLIEIGDLLPETEYFYEISSGSDTFDESGTPFSLTTYATLSSPPPFDTVSGSITGLDDYTDVVVLTEIADLDSTGTTGTSNAVAAVPDSSGNWIASIGDARNSTGSEYYEYTDGDELTSSLYVYAESEPVTVATDALSTADLSIVASLPSGQTAVEKVALLPDYGIFSSAISNGVGGGGDYTYVQNSYTPPSSNSTTPNTGISDFSTFIGIGFAMLTLGIGFMFYSLKQLLK